MTITHVLYEIKNAIIRNIDVFLSSIYIMGTNQI